MVQANKGRDDNRDFFNILLTVTKKYTKAVTYKLVKELVKFSPKERKTSLLTKYNIFFSSIIRFFTDKLHSPQKL